MIEVLSSGPLNTVQDLGRPGLMRLGVGRSGAMDPVSLRLGNLLLGNAEEAAGLELAFFPFAVRFHAPCAFAVTGAAGDARLGERRLPPDYAASAEAGEVLTLERGREGVFAYLCIAGGVEVAAVLGSRATDLKGGYGGLGGRAVMPGARLSVVRSPGPPSAFRDIGVSPTALPGRSDAHPAVLRFIRAAEWEAFGSQAQASFLAGSWTVSREANRQGYRLDGPTLLPAIRRELFSHGLVPGVIQVPPNGRPIVQMAEANTHGGYPKLGVVIGADLPRLAQQRSGRAVAFRAVGRQEALAAAMETERGLSTLATTLGLMREHVA